MNDEIKDEKNDEFNFFLKKKTTTSESENAVWSVEY